MEDQVETNEAQKNSHFFFSLFFNLLQVEILGIIGFLFMGLAAILPGSEPDLAPNPLIKINFGIGIGLLLYLFCWIIAYYQILFRKNFDELKSLQFVSGFIGVFLILLGHNALFSFAVYIFIFAAIVASQRLSARPVDQKRDV